MRLRGIAVAIVLCWAGGAVGQPYILGPPSLQAVLDAIHDDESLVTATRPLLYDSPFDLAALQEALDNKNPYVRWAAAMRLVGNGRVPSLPERLVPVLVDAIKQGGPGARKLAFDRLGSLSGYAGYADICGPVIDEAVIEGLQDAGLRYGATRTLTACPRLPVSIVAREIAASHARLELIEHLGRRGPEAREASDALIMALRDDDWPTSVAAAKTLRLSGVAPERYVPVILEDLAASKDELTRTRAVRTLIEVAPVASRWAPEVIQLLVDEDRPHLRAQLRIALDRMDTSAATGAAARTGMMDFAARSAPLVVFLAAAAAVAVQLARSGWGVLLGYFFAALSLTGFALDSASDWMLPAMMGMPIFGLAGAVAGSVFTRREESKQKRLAGVIGTCLSGIALLFGLLLMIGLYGLFSSMGAG